MQDYVRLAVQGPVHRVGMPPETLATLTWPVEKDAPNDIRAMFGESQEWAGLLTLTLDRRVEALEEVTIGMEGSFTAFALPVADRIDSTLLAPVDPEGRHGELRGNLCDLLSLGPEDHDAISAAIQMHYGACLLAAREVNAAYTLLVGAIELLSQRFGKTSADWDSWSEARKWDKIFGKAELNSVQISMLRSHMLKENKHRNLARGFVGYVMGRLPMTSWSEPVRDWQSQLDIGTGTISGGSWTEPRPRFSENPTPATVERALKGSYRARSEFVHTGKRAVDLAGEMTLMMRKEKAERLTLRALRDALRGLILLELRQRAGIFDLPSVRYANLWTPQGDWVV